MPDLLPDISFAQAMFHPTKEYLDEVKEIHNRLDEDVCVKIKSDGTISYEVKSFDDNNIKKIIESEKEDKHE